MTIATLLARKADAIVFAPIAKAADGDGSDGRAKRDRAIGSSNDGRISRETKTSPRTIAEHMDLGADPEADEQDCDPEHARITGRR